MAIHESEYGTCDQRLLAIEAQESCPFCGADGSLYDESDPESDYGCSKCKSFVDPVTGWEMSSTLESLLGLR